jgi:hypothetical protein
MKDVPLIRSLIVLGTVCTALVARAESEIADQDVRASAARILAEPAFQGFDRFPEGSATAPSAPQPSESTASGADGASSSSSESAESTSRTPASWWDRLRQSREKKAAEGPAPEPSSSDGTSAESGKPPAGGPATPSTTPPAEVARPQRPAGERTPPALQGHDGITRPVRFAPKAPRPPRERSNWNWDFGLGWLVGGIGNVLGGLLHGLAYAALAAICVLIVVLAARALAENWPTRSPAGTLATATLSPLAHDRSPGETEADVFLRTALQLGEQGEYRAALAQLVLGAMSTIERREWIRYRRGLTLNDYLRSVRSRPEQLSGLRTVIGSYEPVEFGRRTATVEVFGAALDGYRQGFVEKSEARNPKPEGNPNGEL